MVHRWRYDFTDGHNHLDLTLNRQEQRRSPQRG